MTSPTKWMVVRVKPRFEKKAEALLDGLILTDPAADAANDDVAGTVSDTADRGPLSFAPVLTATALLFTVVRKWSDRKKKVEVPAVNGYIFAHFNEGTTKRQQLLALTKLHYTPGILRVITKPGHSSFDPEGVATVSDRDLHIFFAAAQQSGGSIQPAEEDPDAITKGKTVKFKEGLLAELGVEFKVDDMRKNQPSLYFNEGIFKNARIIVNKSQVEVVKQK